MKPIRSTRPSQRDWANGCWLLPDLELLRTFSPSQIALQFEQLEGIMSALRFKLTHSDLPLVFIVRADPKPFRGAAFYDGKGSIIICDARRPEFSDLFKVKRGMLRVLKPQPEGLPCETLNFWREPEEPTTKASCCRGTHQAAPPVRPGPLFRGARKTCEASRSVHPARSGCPIRRHGARAGVERVRKTVRAAILRFPSLFPATSSRIQSIINQARPSSTSFNGAAPVRAGKSAKATHEPGGKSTSLKSCCKYIIFYWRSITHSDTIMTSRREATQSRSTWARLRRFHAIQEQPS